MQVGDWEIEDTITWLYFAYFIFDLTTSACVTILMFAFIWKELGESFFDLLRFYQNYFICYWYICSIYNIIWIFYYIEANNLFVKLVLGFWFCFIFWYYIANLSSWYLLMYHIKILQEWKSSNKYEECKKKLKLAEVITLFVIIFSLFFFIYPNVILISLAYYFSSARTYIILAKNILEMMTYVCLLILNIFLYLRLSRCMKLNLYCYFTQNWKSISFALNLTSIYFIAWILRMLTIIGFDVDPYRMIGLSSPFYDKGFRIIYLLELTFIWIMRLFMVFFNFKSVNFKYWILDIYNWYKVSHLFRQPSIFIKRKRRYLKNV